MQRSLASIKQQIYQQFELIVILDGWDEQAFKWIQKQLPSAHILINEHPVGAATARNQALKQAQGEFIAFLDDDDIWEPSYLQVQINYLKQHPQHIFSYVGHWVGNEKSGWLLADNTPAQVQETTILTLLCEPFIHSMSLLVCRKQALEIGLLDSTFSIVHDHEWYVRVLAQSGQTVGRIQQTLVYRCHHDDQLVSNFERWQSEEQIVIETFFKENPQYQHHRATVYAARALFFGHLHLTRGERHLGLINLYNALLVHSAKATLWFGTARLWRNLRNQLTTQHHAVSNDSPL